MKCRGNCRIAARYARCMSALASFAQTRRDTRALPCATHLSTATATIKPDQQVEARTKQLDSATGAEVEGKRRGENITSESRAEINESLAFSRPHKVEQAAESVEINFAIAEIVFVLCKRALLRCEREFSSVLCFAIKQFRERRLCSLPAIRRLTLCRYCQFCTRFRLKRCKQ